MSDSGSDSVGRKKPPKEKNKGVANEPFRKNVLEPTEKAIPGTSGNLLGAVPKTTSESSPSVVAASKNCKIKEMPKLVEVVRAASTIEPTPCPQVMRPALGKKDVNKKDPRKKETKNVPSTSAVAVGLSYAQQVSGGYNKSSSFIEIQGKYVAPRPPPSDDGKSRPKSEEGMQGIFNVRWQDDRYGMHFEHIRGSAQSVYLKAMGAVIPRENIFSFGLVGRGLVEVYTTNLESATKLMLEGVEVAGRHLSACPVTVKPTRVTVSRVPMRADHEDLTTFLKRFGTIHGKVRAIPLRVGDEGLGRGIFSTSREALITLNKGCVLPQGFYLSISGTRSWIGVETEVKCHACHQVGHFVAECPKRARKAAEATAKETSTAVEAPLVVASPNAAPTLDESSPYKVPENSSKEAQNNAAASSLTPARENVTSSDEETKKNLSVRKKLTKRKPKSKASQEVMPPPPKPSTKAASKRRHSEEENGSRSLKVAAVETLNTAECPSGSEMFSLDEEMGLPLSGCESSSSVSTAMSLGSHFEVAQELESIPPGRLRSLLEKLHYKKSSDRILTILKQELKNPRRILPQLEILQKEAKKKRNYNEASRCERLYNKVSQIIADDEIDGSLRQ